MFKVGDKVRCVQPTKILDRHTIYTIVRVDPTDSYRDEEGTVGDTFIAVKGGIFTTVSCDYYATRFELVDQKVRKVTYV